MHWHKRLEAMKGKTYLVNTRQRTIHEVHCKNGQAEVITDKGTLIVTERDLKDFLPTTPAVISDQPANSLIVPTRSEKKELSLTVLNTTKDGKPLSDYLRDACVGAIEKIQTGKDFIDQAKAINATTKVIIDLAKLEFEMRMAERKIKP